MNRIRAAWRILVVPLLLVGLLAPPMAAPRVGLAAGTVNLALINSAYTENFDSLAASGTSSDVPLGWDFVESGNNADATYTAGIGSSSPGDTYSFGASGSSERAFGGLLSGSLTPTIGASFTNNTGAVITQLNIAYTGEMWRAGVANRNAADRLDFQYSLDATSLTTGVWVDVDGLDFNSPNIATTSGAQDGNSAGYRSAVAGSITGLSIPVEGTFWIRWLDFNISGSDDGLAVDDFSLTPVGTPPVGDNAPSVLSVSPANGATGVAADATVTVGFSEPVTAATGAFSLVCNSVAQSVTVSGGATSYTLDPDADLPLGATCTLTVLAAAISDDDATDPPDTMAADFVSTFTVVAIDPCDDVFTPIYTVQGSGATTPLGGQVVTVEGIVVGDYEGPSPALRGFYLQDEMGDGDANTSDGIFVFNGNNNNTVALGERVRVTGVAGDFQDQTQISSVSAIVRCGTGTVAPAAIALPAASATDFERFEGMLVQFSQPLFVTEHFQLGRFGQVVLSSGGRLPQPTNIALPGAPAAAIQAQNNLNRIILDDALQSQNPDPIVWGRDGQPLSASNTLRGGDRVENLAGVLTYTWAGNSASGNAFRIRPTNALNAPAPNFIAANPRPTIAPERAGRVRVAGTNVLNFFNTFDGLPDTVDNCTFGVGGPPADCRGADDQTEFDRQLAKTVAALDMLNADVIGLVEIENDGYGSDSALQTLVNALNAQAGAGAYAFIDADAGTGQVNALGTDAIKVGLLYRPAVVTPVGNTAALNSEAFVNAGDPEPRNRPALAQAFVENGTASTFVVVVNHLKSKGSGCVVPDAGDGQGECAEVRRIAAGELAAWLATAPTGVADPDILILGDLNAYALESAVTTLTDSGFVNLIAQFGGSAAYSYVFDGQWGYLDHALASAAMAPQVSAVQPWHINADEPNVLDYNTNFKSVGQIAGLYAPDAYRMADHDPVLVDLNPANGAPTADAGGPYSVDEGSTVTLAATGADPEGAAVTFAWDLNNDGVFESSGQSVPFAAVDGPLDQPVAVQVSDISALATTDSAMVTVLNVAPSVSLISGLPTAAFTNENLTGNATFTDPGVADTHTATWAWGDGTTTAGIVTQGAGSGSVAGTHSYSSAGSYMVTLTVTDKDGGVSSSTFGPIEVTAPPVAGRGFLAGAGWVASPKGALVGSPQVGGRLILAAVGRSLPAAGESVGAVLVRYRSGGIDFVGVSRNAFAVEEKLATMEGTGALNGRPNHSFLLTVQDSNRWFGWGDKVRLQIRDAGGAVIYDSQPGQPADAAPTLPLLAGNFVVGSVEAAAAQAATEESVLSEVEELMEQLPAYAEAEENLFLPLVQTKP